MMQLNTPHILITRQPRVDFSTYNIIYTHVKYLKLLNVFHFSFHTMLRFTYPERPVYKVGEKEQPCLKFCLLIKYRPTPH